MKNLVSCRFLSFTCGAITVVLANAPFLAASATVSQVNHHQWTFSSDASSTSPDGGSTSTPGLSAEIEPGPLSDGWHPGNVVFGPAYGIWDLGKSGKITLTCAAGLGGGLYQDRTNVVRVRYWFDRVFYPQPVQISMQGAQLIGTMASQVGGTVTEGWLEVETRWRIYSGTPVLSAIIAGADTGTLVDDVFLDSNLAGVNLPALAIRLTPGGSLQLSWSAEFAGMVLQASSGLGAEEDWLSVGSTMQISNGRCVVEVRPSQAPKFYRLKQP